jgi:hypothetical protein
MFNVRMHRRMHPVAKAGGRRKHLPKSPPPEPAKTGLAKTGLAKTVLAKTGPPAEMPNQR